MKAGKYCNKYKDEKKKIIINKKMKRKGYEENCQNKENTKVIQRKITK